MDSNTSVYINEQNQKQGELLSCLLIQVESLDSIKVSYTDNSQYLKVEIHLKLLVIFKVNFMIPENLL